MEKFLITKRAYNPKTSPIMVTTSPRKTCPNVCPLRKNAGGLVAGACYAEHGSIGQYLWGSLDRLPVGKSFKKGQIRIHGFDDLLAAIRQLPPKTVWRHNQAGDLASPDQVNVARRSLQRLTTANRGRKGFTYTHYDVIDNRHNRMAVREANSRGFTINLSANSLRHADQLAEKRCGPVAVILPADQTKNTTTPAGRKVIICPAVTHRGVTCANCQLCARQRTAIVGFPAHGKGQGKITSGGAL